jgi:prepilin-type N-terminal cleavage/methylation domain-containing protein
MLKAKPREFAPSLSFTLIELLVVVAIIGLLAGLAMAAVSSAQAKARDARRIGDLNNLSKALDIYLNANGIYPIWTPGGCTSDGQSNPLISALIPTYASQLPKDPQLNRYCYFYQSDSTGTNYKLAAYLERDPTKASSDGGTASSYYEIFRSSGQQTSQISLLNSDLDKVIINQQTYGEASVVAEWKMDENSWNNDCSTNTALDSSAYANHGKSCPNTTGPLGGETSCMSGKCGLFDGANDYVDSINSISTGSNITISTWINYTAGGDTYNVIYLLGTTSDTIGYHKLFLYNSGVWWEYTNGTSAQYKNKSFIPTPGQWYHIVVTHDYISKQIVFYANGLSLGTVTHIDNVLPVSNKTFKISSNVANNHFKGYIDEARIYNRALSACEVCGECRRFQSKASCNNCTNCAGN